jgi:hypothetical protein
MTTTTTDAILEEAGAESALADLAKDVRRAEAALKAILAENENRTWTIKELQDAAADGVSPSVMSIAFLRLEEAGVVSVDTDLRVHAHF